jgi:hypothetical protein
MIAYAFLQHRRLAAARREKKNQRATAAARFLREFGFEFTLGQLKQFVLELDRL